MKNMLITILMIISLSGFAEATIGFMEETGKQCEYCHVGEYIELNFTQEGDAFVENFYKLPSLGIFSDDMKKKARRFLLPIHAVAGVALLGGILFAGYAGRRIEEANPTGNEKKYMYASVFIIAITGSILLSTVIEAQGAWVRDNSYLFIYLVKALLFLGITLIVAYKFALLGGKIAKGRESKLEDDIIEFRYNCSLYNIASIISVLISITVIVIIASQTF